MPFGRGKKKEQRGDVNENGDKINTLYTLTRRRTGLARVLSQPQNVQTSQYNMAREPGGLGH